MIKIKMGTRGALIISLCMISMIAISILFFVAYRMNSLSCDLVYIEPDKLRNDAIVDWKNSKPSRSQDKTMLIKLAAHLEYVDQDMMKVLEKFSGENLSHPNQTQQQPHQQIPGLPVPVGSDLNNNNTTGRYPNPSIPHSGFTNQHLQNSTMFSNSSLSSSSSIKREDNKRFQKLILRDVKLDRSTDDEYRYTLKFTCATIVVNFIRELGRVHVNHARIHLKSSSYDSGKGSCDLVLPPQGAFSVNIDDNYHLAHYYCDRPLRYRCHLYPPKSTDGSALHLADLLIHKLEFELPGNNSSGKSVHKNHTFLSGRSKYERFHLT